MIIKFENPHWPKSNLFTLVDNKTKKCTKASPSIQFLEKKTLAEIIQWGLARSERMEIVFTKSSHPDI